MQYNFHKKQWETTKIIFAGLILIVLTLGVTVGVDSAGHEHMYQVYCLGDSITYGYGLEEDEREQCC